LNLFKEILGCEEVKEVDINTLLEVLEPDTLLERFAYRKGSTNNNKEFIKLKGTRGQVNKDTLKGDIKNPNPLFGFKNLHYSITESSGTVDITILNKLGS